MSWNNSNLVSNSIWAILDSSSILIGAYWAFKKAKEKRARNIVDQQSKIDRLEGKAVRTEIEEVLNHQLQLFEDKFDTKIKEIMDVLSKVNYAIFNAGKTGLVNKVDSLLEKQTEISISVEVLKSQIKTPARVRRETR